MIARTWKKNVISIPLYLGAHAGKHTETCRFEAIEVGSSNACAAPYSPTGLYRYMTVSFRPSRRALTCLFWHDCSRSPKGCWNDAGYAKDVEGTPLFYLSTGVSRSMSIPHQETVSVGLPGICQSRISECSLLRLTHSRKLVAWHSVCSWRCSLRCVRTIRSEGKGSINEDYDLPRTCARISVSSIARPKDATPQMQILRHFMTAYASSWPPCTPESFFLFTREKKFSKIWILFPLLTFLILRVWYIPWKLKEND